MKPSAQMRRQLQKVKKDAELTEIAEVEAKLESQAPERGVRIYLEFQSAMRRNGRVGFYSPPVQFISLRLLINCACTILTIMMFCQMLLVTDTDEPSSGRYELRP